MLWRIYIIFFCRRVKIWSAEDGSCPVTLTGHSGPVTDTAIVDKGMNIVSTSK